MRTNNYAAAGRGKRQSEYDFNHLSIRTFLQTSKQFKKVPDVGNSQTGTELIQQ